MPHVGQNVFSKLIPEFFRNVSTEGEGACCLYIFQGFPQEFYKELQRVLPHMIEGVSEHYPSVEEFLGESRQLTRAFFDFRKSAWIYYEEFIVMRRTLRQFDEAAQIAVVYNDLFEYTYPLPLGEAVYSSLWSDQTSQEEQPVFNFYADCRKEAEFPLFSFVNCHFEEDTGRADIQEYGFYKTLHLISASDTSGEETRITRMELSRYAALLQNGKLRDCRYRVVGVLDRQSHCMQAMNTLGRFYHVSFEQEDEEDRSEEADRYLPIFQKYWGENKFFRLVKFYKDPSNLEDRTATEYVSQGIIISDILDQCRKAKAGSAYSDIVVTAPTGAGKSVLFQVPAIYLSEQDEPCVTIVISPLVVLMADQVRELEEKGIYYATFINSNITYEERQRRLRGIKEGAYSIVYLSPELLLAHNIQDLLGERSIGLMIVDEAHLVTSWGRDFRVDYWFLGNYLTGIRQNQSRHSAQMHFPVVCLTATAVYGGEDDVIADLQGSLHLNCEQRHMYIGYVVRDDIDFSIRSMQKGADREEKVNLVVKRIVSFVGCGAKTIIYFPYTSQIEDVYRKLAVQHENAAKRTVKYYGSMDSKEKQDSYESFLHGTSTVMLATKAFGMGVNIPDILNVYHYAPTGTLADYVQEIGRAARDLPKGHASIDFAAGDMNSVRILWGMSGLQQYQLKTMMKKLYIMYKRPTSPSAKKSRNLLIAADEFDFLFDGSNIDNAVKSGLMLLSADLYEKYRFKVITVRPKAMLTTQYIRIPPEVEGAFLRQYGDYCEKVNDVHTRLEYTPRISSPITVMREGNIYEVKLNRLWENGFDKMTFAQFKYKFFNGELFDGIFRDAVFCPNLRLVIHYTRGYEKAKEGMEEIARCLQESFSELKQRFGSRMFSFKEFKDIFNKNYGRRKPDDYIRLLLELFVGEAESDSAWDAPKGDWKFLIKRKRNTMGPIHAKNEVGYMILGGKNFFVGRTLMNYLKSVQPNANNGKDFVVYIPTLSASRRTYGERKLDYKQLLASIFQIFDLASYDVEGGRNPQIFVRINDPGKMEHLSRPEVFYQNNILTGINKRHKNGIKIMNGFMTKDFTTEDRWTIIEQYFLGNDEWVHSVLTSDAEKTDMISALTTEKPISDANVTAEKMIRIKGGNAVADMGVTNWGGLGSLLDLDLLTYEKEGLMLPSKINFQVEIGKQSYDGVFLWEQARTMVLSETISSAGVKKLEQEGWLVQFMGTENFKQMSEHMRG